MESIDTLLATITQGDLIKLHLDGDNRSFVGYVWYTSHEQFIKRHQSGVCPSWAENPVIDTPGANVYISGLNPDALEPGNDGFRRGVQLIGIDVSVVRKATIQGIKILGYDILEKSKNLHLPFLE